MLSQEQIANMKPAEFAAFMAKVAARTSVSCKVSEKGALSVYGLGRFPVTLYKGQWENLFSHIDKIKAFIKANSDKLATKD